MPYLLFPKQDTYPGNPEEGSGYQKVDPRLNKVVRMMMEILGKNKEVAGQAIKIVVEKMGIQKGEIFPPDLGGGQEYRAGGPTYP